LRLVVIERLSAVLVCLGLIAGNAAVCAGWLPTPEARMACCTGDEPCPMHKSDSDEHGAKRVISQAEADGCCASSEREDSAPSSSSFLSSLVFAPAPSPVPFATPNTDRATDVWRTLVPIPASHVSKHLLLSVFLV
jgi:hypothetical protein